MTEPSLLIRGAQALLTGLSGAAARAAGGNDIRVKDGVIVAIGDRCVSAELFDRPETLAAFWDEIIASIALDVPKRIDGPRPSVSRALRFLRRVLRAEVESTPGVGLGTEYRFRSERIAAQGLAVDDRLVCLSVLAA